jgi:hypothetical protein
VGASIYFLQNIPRNDSIMVWEAQKDSNARSTMLRDFWMLLRKKGLYRNNLFNFLNNQS